MRIVEETHDWELITEAVEGRDIRDRDGSKNKPGTFDGWLRKGKDRACDCFRRLGGHLGEICFDG